MIMEGDNITIHLASNGSLDQFPENKADAFTNSLQTPIILDANQQYEVALVNIHLPKEVQIIVGDDKAFAILFYKQEASSSSKEIIFGYLPSSSVYSQDPFLIEKMINNDFKENFKTYTGIQGRKLLQYVEEINTFNLRITEGEVNDYYYVSFGPRIAEMLGFTANQLYLIASPGDALIRSKGRGLRPAKVDGNIQYIIVYSDIVKPTPFAGQNVNVLDIFSVGTDGNRGFHNTIYKPLKTTTISNIAIKMANQDGRSIDFSPYGVVTCTLNVRRRLE